MYGHTQQELGWRTQELTTSEIRHEPHDDSCTCGCKLKLVRDEILSHRVLHADETLVKLLKSGSRATHKAHPWAYAPAGRRQRCVGWRVTYAQQRHNDQRPTPGRNFQRTIEPPLGHVLG
jgi:hypothetical protein